VDTVDGFVAAPRRGDHKVGVLALQGDVREHARAFAELGVTALEVRTPADLEAVDLLVLPGGESTTMSLLLETSGLLGPLTERLRAGMPAFGTCAGMILLSADVMDGRPDQHYLAAVDIGVRRRSPTRVEWLARCCAGRGGSWWPRSTPNCRATLGCTRSS